MSDFDRVAATMNANLERLRQPNVLAARPGYVRGPGGYPTQTPRYRRYGVAGFRA